MMRAHGQSAARGTPMDRTRNATRWYAQLKAWWTAHQAMRREAQWGAIQARWDARREAFTPLRADAASDMAMPQGTGSAATVPYGLTL